MAAKLSKIARIAELFQNAYLTGPENMVNVKCEKCGKEFKASKGLSVVNCPECKAINRISNNSSEGTHEKADSSIAMQSGSIRSSL
jgi:phage FluMu protein Com